ncbi:MAG: hypothetical protein M1820_008348 [Bogoriella megaspora]|nr:MAG: hypothetical protein M1820_008348 [Bogoriella megaspora]
MESEKVFPSSRWTSYDDWDWDGMKKRLQDFMGTIDKKAFITCANKMFQKNFAISEPFSAGEHWVCFELVADEDSSVVIARARLPRHPDTPSTVTLDDEEYAMDCEAATMKFLRLRLPNIRCPSIYAYAAPRSELAVQAGCAFMLIEGIYGNTLQDVQFDICQLPFSQQERIFSQWTAIQAELATVTFPQIGSICHVSETGEATLGRLSSAPFEGLPQVGPFADAVSYFRAVAEGRLCSLCEANDRDDDSSDTADDNRWSKLGTLVFLDIVQSTDIYNDVGSSGPFHFNHMDLGTQNILVDESFNFLAIIDWELAHSAPWEVNTYPMPFPLTFSPAKEESILADTGHVAYENVFRQATARKAYRQGFLDNERRLRLTGRELRKSIAETLDSPSAKIFGCFEKLGFFPGHAEALTREIIRLAFNYTGPAQEQYLMKVSSKPNRIFDQKMGPFPYPN